MRPAVLSIFLFLLLSLAGCVSSNRHLQEVDDAYVTDADRASERAEQMAAEEMARAENAAASNEAPENENPAEVVEEEGEYQNEEDYIEKDPATERQERRQERNANRGGRSPGLDTLLYVLGGVLEIGLNILLLYLFW